MIVRKTALVVGLVALGLGAASAAGVASVSAHRQASNPTAPERRVVLAGLGDGASSANMFTPKYIDVYAGDTVTWRIANPADPHTISFGPKALLEQLAKNLMVPAPQRAGPPLLAINPQAAQPTLRATYDGTGFANSGILAAKGQSWSLTFTKPGTYHYICLIHGDGMGGEVIVHPRPAHGHLYIVQAGDGQAASQDQANVTESTAFFPRALTIHEGDTVEWVGGFHTVSFGPDALRHRLEDNVIVRVRGKDGTPQLSGSVVKGRRIRYAGAYVPHHLNG